MAVPSRGAATGSPTSAPIVVGIDGSEPAREALRYAAGLAHQRKLPLRIVSAVTMPELYTGMVPPPPEMIDALQAEGERMLSEAEEAAREVAPRTSIATEVITSPPPSALVDASHSAAMVVIGSTGRGGIMYRMMGSTAVAVCSHATSPVLVVRGEIRSGTSAPVVVGVDDSKHSAGALTVGFEEAQVRQVPLVAMTSWVEGDYETVFSPDQMAHWQPVSDVHAQRLAEQVADVQESFPDVEVREVVARNKPRDELLQRSETAQLVVVGSRGRGGFRGLLLGSTSQALMLHAHCPVLIMREGAEEEHSETLARARPTAEA